MKKFYTAFMSVTTPTQATAVFGVVAEHFYIETRIETKQNVFMQQNFDDKHS